jgi:hypothetical protein
MTMTTHRLLWAAIIGAVIGLAGWWIRPGLEVLGAAAFVLWFILSEKF